MPHTAGRRFPVLAVLGLLAVTALAGCRADPAVAAYVGEVRITEAAVDQVIDGLRTELAGTPQAEQLEQQLPALRTQVVHLRVLTEAATSHAGRTGLELPAPDLEQVGTGLGLPGDSGYVAVVAAFQAARDALRDSVDPVPPTEADQREVYDHLVAENGLTLPFAQVQPELDAQLLGQPVALRNLLSEVVAEADVQLNPRYDRVYQLVVPIGNTQTWLGVPLGEESAVVESGSRR